MKEMRIAIFTDTFYPQIDGIVTATLSLAKELAKRGHKIYIIAPENYSNYKEFKFKNIVVKRVPGIPAGFYKGFKITSGFNPAILNYLIKKNIDLIHFQTPVTVGISAIMIARIMHVPLVGTFHTMINREEYRKHAGLNYPFLDEIAKSYVRAYYNRTDLITCPSKSIATELKKMRFESEIKVVSNGISPKMFNNFKSSRIKKKYNPNGPLILFVGRIAYEKNILYLLDCFKLISKQLKNAKLLVVGDGPQMEELKAKIAKENLQEKVILTGRIEHEELLKSGIFGASNIFITASLTETQGITLLEAQANGLPSVGVNATGTKDLIKNGYNGFLIKNGDKKEFAKKVIKILSDNKLREKMRKNTLEEIKPHYLSNVIDQWEEIYSELIKKRARIIKKNKKKNILQTLFTNFIIKRLRSYDLLPIDKDD